uniref:Uncharacterized protein n=1 Tax=Salarias fasciatus TaxID=181472 RepID=A0A672FQ34_SALFA
GIIFIGFHRVIVAPSSLLLDKHADSIAAYGSKKDGYESTLWEYLRMSGIYWGPTVMDLVNQAEIAHFIKAPQHEYGGISASIRPDPHLLYTLSAVQTLDGFHLLTELPRQGSLTPATRRLNYPTSRTTFLPALTLRGRGEAVRRPTCRRGAAAAAAERRPETSQGSEQQDRMESQAGL